MATDLSYEYQIERRVDTMAEMLHVIDEPDWPLRHDDLRDEAEWAMIREALGWVVTKTWWVIPWHGVNGWTWRAEVPGTEGIRYACAHVGTGGNEVLSKAAAVAEHQRVHVGE